MRYLVLAAVIFCAVGCRRDPIGAADLDRLEASLALTPAQRPAWLAFRKEAEALNGSQAAWRVQLSEALSGERFDASRAHTAADTAREDAGRLIEAWQELDATLSPTQRAALKDLDR